MKPHIPFGGKPPYKLEELPPAYFTHGVEEKFAVCSINGETCSARGYLLGKREVPDHPGWTVYFVRFRVWRGKYEITSLVLATAAKSEKQAHFIIGLTTSIAHTALAYSYDSIVEGETENGIAQGTIIALIQCAAHVDDKVMRARADEMRRDFIRDLKESYLLKASVQ